MGLRTLAWGAVSKNIFEGRDLRTGEILQWQVRPQKIGVVLFLSTRCPNSRAHLEEIKKTAPLYPEFSFVAIHSNADESEDEARGYFKKHALPFPVLRDKDSQIAERLKALKTPHVFVLNAEGEILYQGGVTDSADPVRAKRFYLQEALRDIKEGKTVQTPEGRTLGCRMVRAKEMRNEW